MARKTNITGIPMLSIGTTKNDKELTLTRYLVNHKIKGSTVCKSFYFGVNTSQKDAFVFAIQYMRKHELYLDDMDAALNLFNQLSHETLI